jgi:hypothetical protein
MASRNPQMRRLVCRLVFWLGFVALPAAMPVAAHAQFIPVPAQPGYATNPPVADSPLQQQIMRNYRTDLQQAQRELAVQNPSGLSRDQLDVTHRLNSLNSTLTAPPAASMTPAASPAGSVPGTAPLR